MTRIDLDAHATTPLHPAAWEALARVYYEANGNPASNHAQGRQARRALDRARESVAQILGVTPTQVTFTSGATEANNLALFGQAPVGTTLVASRLEHPCVVGPLETLATRGYSLQWLPVTPAGQVDLAALEALAVRAPALVCVMLANHETGVVQPVRAVAERLAPGVRLHCDAAQAVGKIPVSFPALGVSTLSLSGHKFGAPKGVGAIITHESAVVQPLFQGGHQQSGLRPGTEPVALAAALAAALEVSVAEMAERTVRLRAIRTEFLTMLELAVPPVTVQGAHPEDESGLPSCLNLAFPGCRSDLLLMRLDLAGVSCSAGAACASGSSLPSPVLRAMGVAEAVLRSAVRFSFGPDMTADLAREAARRVIDAVRVVRA